MNSEPTVIIIPEDKVKVKEPETQQIQQTQQAQPTSSGWSMVWSLLMLYIVIGIICYVFNKEWFEYLYMNPYNYIRNLFNKKTENQTK